MHGREANTAWTSKRLSPTNVFGLTSMTLTGAQASLRISALGNWGLNHPIQQSDVDQHFSIFAFMLSIDRDTTWLPCISPDGSWIEEMQLCSLFLTFSLLGEALLNQFEWLNQRGLLAQWNAEAAFRRCHAYFFFLSTHCLLAKLQ